MLIKGDGVAARCCGRLLTQAGYGLSWEPGVPRRVPVLMLGEQAQKLMADVFGRSDLFRDLPQITKRVVAWGANASVELPHSAVVLSEEALLNRLGDSTPGDRESDWTIYAAPPLPADERRFGSRVASAALVETINNANACWIESLQNGWLFLVADWLIAVGGSIDELLAQSKLISPQIARCESAGAHFPSSPRIVKPLGGNRWIACGSAAIAFDPICGDGTAHAVREAILASAVIRAAARGEGVSSLIEHYENRLTQAIRRHLEECLKFYSTGGNSHWWRAQQESTIGGLAELMPESRAHYRLVGFDLKPLDA